MGILEVREKRGYLLHLVHLVLDHLLLVPMVAQRSPQECDAKASDPGHTPSKRFIITSHIHLAPDGGFGQGRGPGGVGG